MPQGLLGMASVQGQGQTLTSLSGHSACRCKREKRQGEVPPQERVWRSWAECGGMLKGLLWSLGCLGAWPLWPAEEKAGGRKGWMAGLREECATTVGRPSFHIPSTPTAPAAPTARA